MYFFMVGTIAFVWNQVHVLSSLISLEYMAMIIFLTITLISPLVEFTLISMIFISISVCEGALGLSILINFARAQGSDFMSNMALNLW
uniref:NADH-ubiquinone oxidoreductase chain 4L n=1 Tax=Bragasellus molinai TaxID=1281925 RepID=A0A485M7E9_9CRUS|nr:NADH dehydrogenase subunit 4l [Bragasellus molinai]